ncbi:hypothetical protein [Methylobacterium sp. P5_C11]
MKLEFLVADQLCGVGESLSVCQPALTDLGLNTGLVTANEILWTRGSAAEDMGTLQRRNSSGFFDFGDNAGLTRFGRRFSIRPALLRPTILDQLFPADFLALRNLLQGRSDTIFLDASHRALPVSCECDGRSELWRNLMSAGSRCAARSTGIEVLVGASRSTRCHLREAANA